LIDDGSDEERSLLAAARRDRAPRAVQAHVLASLGVASGVAVTTSSASAGILGIAKWLGAGLIAGTVVTSGATLLLEHPKASYGGAAHEVPAPAPAVAAAPAVRRDEAPADPAPPPPAVDNPSKKAGPTLASPATPEARRLADEIASLDRARGALGAGDPQKAIRELDRHSREFPRGALAPEAEVLRIESLLRTGQRARAASLARRFLERHGRGPHASRVRSLLAQAEKTAPSAGFPATE
jgi:TolA-binding protein